MSASVTFPVQVLREHLTGLEAAISVCLADPDHKPVHKLRTETRRVEALLLLLALVPGLPEHRKQATALLRALAKLRRAAGEVRDLDVHRKMLESFGGTEDAVAEPQRTEARRSAEQGISSNGAVSGGKSPGRKANSSDKAAQPVSAGELATAAELSKSALQLRKKMGRDRDKAATALQQILKHRQAKTAKAAEELLKVLEPAQEMALAGPELLRDAQAVLGRDGLLRGTRKEIAGLDEDELHTLRKAAKAARYVAEALPGNPEVADAARGFEALQEAGGQWHDALELARAARRYFGKGHELTAAYRAERDRKLKAYRAALTATTQGTRPAQKRKLSSAGKSVTSRRAAA